MVAFFGKVENISVWHSRERVELVELSDEVKDEFALVWALVCGWPTVEVEAELVLAVLSDLLASAVKDCTYCDVERES